MGEITNQIEQEIREHRSDLGRNLGELQDKARELADWRTHYREHSRIFLGAAFGTGLLLGLTTLSKRQSSARDFEPDTSHDPFPPKRAGFTSRNQTVVRAQRHFGETWEQIADGLLRLASAKAIEFVAEMVPGFSDHLDGSDRQRPLSGNR